MAKLLNGKKLGNVTKNMKHTPLKNKRLLFYRHFARPLTLHTIQYIQIHFTKCSIQYHHLESLTFCVTIECLLLTQGAFTELRLPVHVAVIKAMSSLVKSEPGTCNTLLRFSIGIVIKWTTSTDYFRYFNINLNFPG